MFQDGRRPVGTNRRGVILLVVLCLLTLFAVLGISFVLYAEAAARSAQLARDAESPQLPDVQPEQLFSYFLGQLLYDLNDDSTGVASALRGYSLARSMYGFNDQSPNFTPFNGTGRLHGPSPLAGVDDYELINYTYFPSDGFLRDPERLGSRTDLSQQRGLFCGGFNAPYTYPDANNLFLAAVKADGTVLAPSYFRDWLFRDKSMPASVAALDMSNVNWHSQEGKYRLLRPRPDEMGPGFPYPEDKGGDVKNLDGGPGGNDSLWLDLGFPVLTAPDGRRYKPLFAPLVTDLDNRVNINVHGNVRGRDAANKPDHASNQGWGSWEVSLKAVLKKQPSEWTNLFLGSTQPPLLGRYGGTPWNGIPGTPSSIPSAASPGTIPHFYGPLDYDACDETAGQRPSGRLLLPGQTASTAGDLCPFPTAQGGYGNGTVSELTEHPSLFNAFSPGGDRRTFDASNLEALLRANGTGSPALTSQLVRLCPTALSDPRARGMVTTHSFDVDKPGVSPWIFDPNSSGYQASGPDQPPQGPAIPFPNLSARLGKPPAGSEFAVDWRAASAALERIDLNRPLAPFPHQGSGSAGNLGPPLCGPNDRFDTPQAESQFREALFERQRLVDDIYRHLLVVTGVPPALDPASPTNAELLSRRWLAQLAANIVDFIDEDEISTPFNFYTEQDAYPGGRPPRAPPFDSGANSGDPEFVRYWVFGTELPRLVVNEVLAEFRDLNVPLVGAVIANKVWVELHNPMQTPTANSQTLDGQPVVLTMPGLTADMSSIAHVASNKPYLPYQIVIADRLATPTSGDNVLGKPQSVRGQSSSPSDSDFATVPALINGTPLGAPPAVAPQGYFLLGPQGPDLHDVIRAVSRGGDVPDATPVLWLGGMQYPVTYTSISPLQRVPDDTATGITVLLRRLANPHIPYDPSPTITTDGEIQPNPWYNPYMTVDYIEKVPPRNGTNPMTPYGSRGKNQPYASAFKATGGNINLPAADSPVVDQHAGGLTRHSFGKKNDAPENGHYDWLVHLDRGLISAMELLYVSACVPHLLTQRFIAGGASGERFNQLAPWFDPKTRLYRAFEFLQTRDRAAGVTPGGRVPGKINLNTVWDPEPLLALCDPQPANAFTDADVKAIFAQMQQLRTPGGAPGPRDRPFLSLATGYTSAGDSQYAAGSGIEDTLLRSFDGTSPRRLFQQATDSAVAPDDPARHPYTQFQLLTKIFNNATNRSNVFAVWLTVGFFEVTDDTSRPVKLGAEMGRAENRHVRHRMFAVVDRSVIPANWKPQPRFDPRSDAAVLYLSIID